MVRDDTVATYTRPEVEALIDAAATLYPARSQWWSALIVTAWTTGMRIGELDHLRWADLDLNERTWSVRPRSAGIHNGYPIFAWEPKGRKSRGPYTLPDRTVAVLSALKVSTPQLTPYVFLSPSALARIARILDTRGHLPDRNVSDFKDHFPRIYKRAAVQLGEWQSGRAFHTLRKTFGTEMSEHVMPPVLQDLMGHAKIETTMGCYVSRTRRSTGDKIRQCFDGPAAAKLASTA